MTAPLVNQSVLADGSAHRNKAKFVTIGKGDHPLPVSLFTDREHNNDDGLWLFINREMFIGESAKRWSHLTKETGLSESVHYDQTNIELFALFAQFHDDITRAVDFKPECVISMGQVVSALDPEKWVGMFIHIRSQSDRGVSIAHSWQKMLYLHKLRRNRRFDPSYGERDDDDLAGLGFELNGADDCNNDDDDDDEENGGGGGGKKRKKSQKSAWKKKKLNILATTRKTDPKYTFSDMTSIQWEQQCLYYTGTMAKTYKRDYGMSGYIANERHPFNPFDVFSLGRFMAKCKAAGAHPSYYDPDCYHDPDDPKKWRLPENGKHFYRVRKQEFEPGPEGIWSYFFPHVQRPGRMDRRDRQRQLFIDMGGDEAVANQIFNKNASDDATANEASLAARMQEEILKAKQECGDTPDGLAKFAKMAHKIRQRGLREWFSVGWNPDSDVSDSVKAVHDWFNGYLYANGRDKVIHRDLPCMSGNLNSFDDKMVRINLMLDTAYSMRNMQQELMVLILGSLQVPLKTKMHLHALLTGPPAIGKTYIAEVVMDLFIKKTVSKVQMSSEKAYANGGCASSNLTIIREECVGSLLGVDDSMFKGKAKYSNATEVANFKSLLTSSEVNADRTLKNMVTGELYSASIKTEMNCQHICCANTSIKDADPAVCSRFYCIACTEKDCERWRELRASTNNETPEFMKFKDSVRDYMRLQQALIFMISGLINCGVLPQIDLEVPNSVIQMVMDKGAEQGMPGTKNKRNKERLQFVCQSLVMLRAINKLWESPLSPLKGEEWQYDHLLLVAPYLVGEIDDARKALTLLQNQFESPLQRDLLDIMQKCFFKISVGQPRVEDAIPSTNPDPPLRRRQSSQRTTLDYYYQESPPEEVSLPLYPDCPPECVDPDPQHTHYEPFTGTLDQKLYAYKSLVATQQSNKPRSAVGGPPPSHEEQRPSGERRPESFRSDGAKLGELTRQLVALFKRQVLSDDVFMILKNLRDTTIPSKNGMNSDPALTFAGDTVMIHKNLFSKNDESRNKLLDIIKNVTRHRYSREQNVLLLSMQNATGVMDMIHLAAGTPEDPLLEVPNYNFMDESTRRCLGSVVAAIQNAPGGGGNGKSDPRMPGVFSDRPFYIANADLDDAKCLTRRAQLGFTHEYVQAMRLPPLLPYEYEQTYAVVQEKDMKPDYPHFLHYIDRKRIDHAFRAESKDPRFRSQYEMTTLMEHSSYMLIGGKSDGTFEDDSADGHYVSDNEDDDKSSRAESVPALAPLLIRSVPDEDDGDDRPLSPRPPPPSPYTTQDSEEPSIKQEEEELVSMETDDDSDYYRVDTNFVERESEYETEQDQDQEPGLETVEV